MHVALGLVEPHFAKLEQCTREEWTTDISGMDILSTIPFKRWGFRPHGDASSSVIVLRRKRTIAWTVPCQIVQTMLSIAQTKPAQTSWQVSYLLSKLSLARLLLGSDGHLVLQAGNHALQLGVL